MTRVPVINIIDLAKSADVRVKREVEDILGAIPNGRHLELTLRLGATCDILSNRPEFPSVNNARGGMVDKPGEGVVGYSYYRSGESNLLLLPYHGGDSKLSKKKMGGFYIDLDTIYSIDHFSE